MSMDVLTDDLLLERNQSYYIRSQFDTEKRMAAATKKKAVKKAAKKDVKETKKAAKAVTKKATGKNGEYFSVPELARHEDVSIKTIYNWILEGKIKVEREGRLYRIPKKTYRRPENKTAKKR